MFHKKPKIGISLRVVNAPNYNEKRDALSQEWPKILEELEFVPIYIPNTLSKLTYFLEEVKINGIILSGGDNIGKDNERDETESKILEFSIKKNIPVFGVCRGMQIINNYFGGKLTIDETSNHECKPHEIKLIDEKFSLLFNSTSIHVNSYHRNIIKLNKIGKNLKPFAIFSEDNSVEGFLHETLPIIGVMWHPEREPNKFNKLILTKVFQNTNFWKNKL